MKKFDNGVWFCDSRRGNNREAIPYFDTSKLRTFVSKKSSDHLSDSEEDANEIVGSQCKIEKTQLSEIQKDQKFDHYQLRKYSDVESIEKNLNLIFSENKEDSENFLFKKNYNWNSDMKCHEKETYGKIENSNLNFDNKIWSSNNDFLMKNGNSFSTAIDSDQNYFSGNSNSNNVNSVDQSCLLTRLSDSGSKSFQEEKILSLSSSHAPAKFNLMSDPNNRDIFPNSNSEGLIKSEENLLDNLNKSTLFSSLNSGENSQRNLLIDTLNGNCVKLERSNTKKRKNKKRKGRMKFFEESEKKTSKRQKRSKRKKSHKIKNGNSRYKIDIDNAHLDSKTTLMIRNIPNKYTQDLMLERINRRFKGSYDFFYLPIDFRNKCNVGYAFINLKDTKDIKSFFLDFNGKKWEMFNSEKICSINYARIQGRDGLIKHFKNSSVMNQNDKKVKPLIINKKSISELVKRQRSSLQKNSKEFSHPLLI